MPDRRYLGLRLAGRDLAVDAAEVAAVLPGHDFAAIAHPHSWIRGVARHENADLLVVDLAELRGWGRSRQTAIVILTSESQYAAIFADRVSGLLTPLRIQPKAGVVLTAGRCRILISAAEVLRAAQGSLRAGAFPLCE